MCVDQPRHQGASPALDDLRGRAGVCWNGRGRDPLNYAASDQHIRRGESCPVLPSTRTFSNSVTGAAEGCAWRGKLMMP